MNKFFMAILGLFSANPPDMALFCTQFSSFFRNFAEIYGINLHISEFFRNFVPKF